MKAKLYSLENDLHKKEKTLQDENLLLQNEISSHKFTVDRFKHNKEHFKFYTRFESYELFKAVLNFIQPAADKLYYWGNTSKENLTMENSSKLGRKRKLSTEEEFFLVLVRLRGGFPLEDLGIRYQISTSNISRILITWFDFLHTQFRAIPIWATRQTVDKTMPMCFQKLYPKTRVIFDCTELFTEMPTSYRSQSATFSN